MFNASYRMTLVLAAFTAMVSSPVFAQEPAPPYTKDLPKALVKEARIKEADAAKTALARVPTGHIQAVELENEDGRLIYSYEIKVTGRKGIEEVNVNAKTGAVVNIEHENPETEKKEGPPGKNPSKG